MIAIGALGQPSSAMPFCERQYRYARCRTFQYRQEGAADFRRE
jgi:hypothetical protein